MVSGSQYIPIKRQLMTGMNTRGHPQIIGASQVELAINVDFTQLGRSTKRKGVTAVANDVGAFDFTNLARFNPAVGGDIILGMEDTNLRKWNGTGNWSAVLDSGFTSNLYAAFIIGNSLCLISNGTDNVHSIDSADTVSDLGDTNASPPKGLVGLYFKERFFIADGDSVYFSDTASTTFDRSTNFFRVNNGDNSAGGITNIIPFRQNELIIFKEDSVWILVVLGSTPLTDWTLQPVDASNAKSIGYGCISKDAAIKVGDDIYYWATDGVRSLRRNEQDKIMGLTLPVSDPIFTSYVDSISFANTDQIRATYFQNRLIFAVPFDGSTVPNYWFVYHFQTDPSMNGWAVWKMGEDLSSFVRYKISGEERLYFSDNASNGQMYQAFSGTSDNGTAIEFELRGRMEDLSQHGLEGHRKVCQSLYSVFESSDGDTVTVEAQKDEGGFTAVGTKLLTNQAPLLPQTLPFDLNNDTVVREKFDCTNFEHWYNFQWRITQDALDEEITVQEILMMVTSDGYEFQVNNA